MIYYEKLKFKFNHRIKIVIFTYSPKTDKEDEMTNRPSFYDHVLNFRYRHLGWSVNMKIPR